jgi:site-specific recombinase XerC
MSDVDAHSVTVGQYLGDWLAGKHELKPKTAALYRDALDHYLIPHLGSIRLMELRAHHLDRFYVSIAVGRRGKPLSPSSIRRINAALRSALNAAVKRRLIPYNPALHIEFAAENSKRPKPWTAEQAQTFHLRDHREAQELEKSAWGRSMERPKTRLHPGRRAEPPEYVTRHFQRLAIDAFR